MMARGRRDRTAQYSSRFSILTEENGGRLMALSQTQYKCTYCLRLFSEAEFNREHVMPQHLGKFRENLVLSNAVCCDCNKTLEDQLELWLGRDSVEGLHRWRFGQKPISDFKQFRGRGVKLWLPRGSASPIGSPFSHSTSRAAQRSAISRAAGIRPAGRV